MEDDKFTKLTKAEKLKIVESEQEEYKYIQKALFIPLKKKNSGYTVCAFFVQVNDKWFRLMNYDSFRFVNAHEYLRGDFENGGVQFFLGERYYSCDYGGQFNKIK